MSTGTIKGAEVGFLNSFVPTQRLGCCTNDSEREDESADSVRLQKYVLAEVSSPPQ